MRRMAIKPPKNLDPKLAPVEDGTAFTPLYVDAHVVINDVRKARWAAFGKGKQLHGFLVPAGAPFTSPTGDGLISPVCGRKGKVADLIGAGPGRCKTCQRLLTDDSRKRSTGLTEPSVENVDTGVSMGDPKAAEQRRVVDLAPLTEGGVAHNAEIVGLVRNGMSGEASSLARKYARQHEALVSGKNVPEDHKTPKPSIRHEDGKYVHGASSPFKGKTVPEAARAPIGNRDHGMLNGVAMVQGPNVDAKRGKTNWNRPPMDERDMPACMRGVPMVEEANPDAGRPTWRNPRTFLVEPAAARLDGSLRERPDREIVERVDRNGIKPDTARPTKSAKRRARAKRVAERVVRERLSAKGVTPKLKPKGRMIDPIKAELKRLSALGEDLPARGW